MTTADKTAILMMPFALHSADMRRHIAADLDRVYFFDSSVAERSAAGWIVKHGRLGDDAAGEAGAFCGCGAAKGQPEGMKP